MFLGADIVVQAVMVGLVVASVLTWTAFVAKLVELAAANRALARSLRRIDAHSRLDAAVAATGDRRGPLDRMVRAAAAEHAAGAATVAQAGSAGLKERVASHLARIEAGAGRRITRGTGLLAIIGSTAPFVGLFGTVWGIM
ncbi:MAG: MotA/TolQ/ExbB proton channel family protein, partial [Rubellimicrobium sp.]|nr:MotA/TolQ/ExbB proton channel family protein [Rubellimicrobium sp.]